MRKLKSGGTFLEVGAGNLKLSQELLRYFDHGVVLDFEPEVKKIWLNLNEQVRQKLDLKIGDFSSLKTGETFDCVVACEVMEHVKDDRQFLEHISRLLKPGGQVIISVPAKNKYWSVHDEVAGHFRRYNKRQALGLFSKVGFHDVQVYSYGFPFVNMLRLLRVAHGKRQAKTKSNWSNKKKTQRSGVGQISSKYDFVGWLVNPVTFWLPNLISSLFNKYDLSEAYVIVATK